MDDSKENIFELVSDNKFYQSYEVKTQDIMEVWEAVMFISQNFPDPSSEPSTDIENLKNIVLDLQQEVIKLKDRD
jgi:hypothetical protein